MSRWFRHYLPVVVDLETGGVDPLKHPILEIACVALEWRQGKVSIGETFHAHVDPHPGAICEPASLEVTGIIPDHPFRYAISEDAMLKALKEWLLPRQKRYRCHKSILVGHNAHFDLGFLNQACLRHPKQAGMFHKFSVIDTVSLGMAMYGQTVLAKVAHAAGIAFDEQSAHSAIYDAEVTADIFCHMINTMGYHGAKP